MGGGKTVPGSMEEGAVARVETGSIAGEVDRRAKILADKECRRSSLTSVMVRQWCPFCKGALIGGYVDHEEYCPTGMVAKLEAERDELLKVLKEHNPTIQYLARAVPMCECDHSVGMAPCLDCATRQAAMEFALALSAVEAGSTPKQG